MEYIVANQKHQMNSSMTYYWGEFAACRRSGPANDVSLLGRFRQANLNCGTIYVLAWVWQSYAHSQWRNQDSTVLSRPTSRQQRSRSTSNTVVGWIQRGPWWVWTWMPVWLSGNMFVSINILSLRRDRLVPGWVTVLGWVNHLGSHEDK